MDIQKYFNKGPITRYAVFSRKILQRITDENVEGSIPFETQTYEMAEDTPNSVAEIKELFIMLNSYTWKKQGQIELVFLKIMLSPRVLRNRNFRREFEIKVKEALRIWPNSKIIKDAPKVLKMNEPVITGVLGPV